MKKNNWRYNNVLNVDSGFYEDNHDEKTRNLIFGSPTLIYLDYFTS